MAKQAVKQEERQASLVSIAVTIRGTSPLLMSRIPPGALPDLPGGQTTVTIPKPKTVRGVAEAALYTNAKGEPVVPHSNLFACLIGGGTFHYVKAREKISTRHSSLIPACCEIDVADYVVISKAGWVIDSRIYRSAKTGDPGWTHRPRFDDWEITFVVTLDVTMMPAEVLLEVLKTAGKRVGLCAWTPRHKGPMGKFDVIKWEVTVKEWVEAA